jgi:thioredoxin 1
MGNVVEITDSAFEKEVLESETPVLVDFWAPWCAPCRAIAPVVEEISGELNGKLKVVKMNVDENTEVPGKLGIRSIPTLKVFVNGSEVDQMIGSASKEQIKKLLSSHVT